MITLKQSLNANEHWATGQAAKLRERLPRAAVVWTERPPFEPPEALEPDVWIAPQLPTERRAALTDDEKLEAIERGDAGSYNLAAPRSGDPFVRTNFQHVAAMVLGIARGRGYVFRRVPDGHDTYGLLVTIPSVTSAGEALGA
jgi:hypothetical protein